MNQYTNSIDECLKSIIQAIEQYTNYDNNATLSKKTIADIKKEIEVLNEKSLLLLDIQAKRKTKIQEEIETDFNNLKKDKAKKDKEISTLEKNQIKEINLVTKDCDNQINEIEAKLKSERENINNEIEENEKLSIENLEYFINDFKETEKRLSFKNQSSRDSYNNCINRYNDNLDDRLKSIDKAYSRLYISYDADTKALINKYTKQIEDLKNQYQDKLKEKESYIKGFLKENKEDAIKLNDEIRPLYDEKNKKIEYRRQEYQKEQNLSNIEKENKKQEYHNESNKITKDFIVNIKEIDTKIEELTQAYNQNKNTKINSTLYTILEEHKKLELDVKELMNELDGSNDLKIKKLIKLKYKAFAGRKYRLEEKLNNELRNLEATMLRNVENENFERKKLELEKNREIKKYIEKENSLNKIYQEINNKSEYNLKCDEEKYKIQYDINSSTKKLAHSLEQTKKTKIKNIELAKFDEALENINFKIKNAEANLTITKSLNSYVHEYEDKVYLKKKNFFTVYNMLEIEKNKTIFEYNNNLYMLKLREAKEELNYNKTLANLKNKHFSIEKEKAHNITIEKANNEIININLKRDKAKLKSDITIGTTKQNNDHLFEKNKLTLIDSLYNLDYISFTNYTSSFYLLFKEGYSTIISIYSLIKESVESKTENIFEIRNFFISIKNSFIEYFKYISKYYTDFIKEVALNREKNIRELYYNELIENLKTKKQLKIDTIKRQISKDREAIEELKDNITFNKKKIYNLKNQDSLTIISKLKLKKTKIDINKIILANNKSIRHLESNINKNQKNIDKAIINYNTQNKIIENKIKKGIKSYLNLYDDLIENLGNLFNKAENNLNRPNVENANSYFENLEVLLSKSYSLVNKEFSNIYLTINDFKIKRNKELDSKKKKLKYVIQYNEIKNNIHNNKEYNSLNEKYKIELKNNKNKIRSCELDYEKAKFNSHHELNQYQAEYNKITKNLQKMIIESGQSLYESLYAVIENMSYIENDFHYAIGDEKNPNTKDKSLADEFKDNEYKLISRNNENKFESAKSLEIYIENKKQEIQNHEANEIQSIKQINGEYHLQEEKYKKQASENNVNLRASINECDNKILETKKNLNKDLRSIDNECKLLKKEDYKNYRNKLRKKEKSILKKKYIS